MTTITLEYDDRNKSARQMIEIILSLGLATRKNEKEAKKNAWEQAIAEGAVTLDEFGNRFTEEIHKAYQV